MRYSSPPSLQLGGQPLARRRLAREPLEAPRKLRGGRLVSGHERGHQLVADLARLHRRPVAVAGAQQQREHVVALAAVATALVDERVDELVRLAGGHLQARPRAAPAQERAAVGNDRQRALAEGQDLREQRAQPIEARAAAQAEHRLQDDLEREALQPGMQGNGLVARPGGDLGLGQLGHHAREALHALTVERGQKQLALLQVRSLVEQDHRVASDDRLEDARPLAGVQHVRRGLEHLLDLVGVREHHERRRPDEPNREAWAVPVAAALEESRWDGSRSRSSAAARASAAPGEADPAWEHLR